MNAGFIHKVRRPTLGDAGCAKARRFESGRGEKKKRRSTLRNRGGCVRRPPDRPRRSSHSRCRAARHRRGPIALTYCHTRNCVQMFPSLRRRLQDRPPPGPPIAPVSGGPRSASLRPCRANRVAHRPRDWRDRQTGATAAWIRGRAPRCGARGVWRGSHRLSRSGFILRARCSSGGRR
jgi:hypothetical protein